MNGPDVATAGPSPSRLGDFVASHLRVTEMEEHKLLQPRQITLHFERHSARMSSSDIKIPFPLSSAPGARAQEGTGRLINCFAEARGDSPPMWRRAPGLTNFGTTPRTGCRGLIEINGILYSAWNGFLELHTTAGGASTNIPPTASTFFGTKKGFFARNNKPPELGGPDQWFVDPDGNIAIFTPSAVTPDWPGAVLPAVNSTCVINGYGVFTTGDGRAFATDLNDLSLIHI